MAASGGGHRNQSCLRRDNGRAAFRKRSRIIRERLGASAKRICYGEEDIVALAVRLLAGIAQAHAFEQGNKRTSFIAMIELLMINGYDLAIDDTATWADEVIALVEHGSTEDDFIRTIRPFVVPR